MEVTVDLNPSLYSESNEVIGVSVLHIKLEKKQIIIYMYIYIKDFLLE